MNYKDTVKNALMLYSDLYGSRLDIDDHLFAVEKNCIPMAPHLLFPQFMDEATERWLGLKMGIVLLSKCEQVWVFGDVISEGMTAEIEKAKKQHKRIRFFTEDLKEVGHEDCLW